MDCAICLTHIQRQDEAYLYPCCHFFCVKCIQEWTDRQRQHAPEEDCPPGQRCTFACPLCKTAYQYVVYENIGSSCRLIPTCGQPKTMSAMPLTPDQSRRRALYVTPAQLAHGKWVPQAKRPRSPTDGQTVKFVQRELQAVLLTEDVDIIAQHLTGVLQILTKKQAFKHSSSSTSASSGLYGDRTEYLDTVSRSMGAFLQEHSDQFAEQLWSFLHSGLTVVAYDRLLFAEGPPDETEVPQDQLNSSHETEAGTMQPDW